MFGRYNEADRNTEILKWSLSNILICLVNDSNFTSRDALVLMPLSARAAT